MEYAHGEKYKGNWKRGRQHGHGISTFNGDKYDGEWNDGQRTGKGVIVYHYLSPTLSRTTATAKVEDKYTGRWKNNELQGRGVMIYSNGDEYDGDWNRR